ncbi:MAG: hypothetical protein PHV34_12760 [Verrucomicrobiae bacterium]|nr:hypothetical protein [Verrucomicrobiae bacterium]
MKTVAMFFFASVLSALAQVEANQITQPVKDAIPPFMEFVFLDAMKQTEGKTECVVSAKCTVKTLKPCFKDGEDAIPVGTTLEIPVALTFVLEKPFYKFRSMTSKFQRYSETAAAPAPVKQRVAEPQKVVAAAKKEAQKEIVNDDEEGGIDGRAKLIAMCQPNKVYKGTANDNTGIYNLCLKFIKCNSDDEITAEICDMENKMAAKRCNAIIRKNSRISQEFELLVMPDNSSVASLGGSSRRTIRLGKTVENLIPYGMTLTYTDDGEFVGRSTNVELLDVYLTSQKYGITLRPQ